MDFAVDCKVEEAVEKLESFIATLESMSCARGDSKLVVFQAYKEISSFLEEVFWDDSVASFFQEKADYQSPIMYFSGMSDEQAAGVINIGKSRKALRSIKLGLENTAKENNTSAFSDATTSPAVDRRNCNKVFVVHGHDAELRLEVTRLLEQQSLEPVVLKDQPNGGKTIIEKFEANADVGFAVILLSGDDEVKTSAGESELRARQNVILELGYFIGALKRERVCALRRKNVDLPSDIHGIVYTDVDEAGYWKYELLKELEVPGYKIDRNLVK